MNSSQQIDPDQFVSEVQPLLERQDPLALRAFIKSRWNGPQVVLLLRSQHEDARKVAALCLSLVGTNRCVGEISKLLRDTDPTVNQLAEHALWSIWFRGGSDPANHQLGRGAQAIERRDYHHAIEHFNRALELCPEFPEAYNQRSIARHLLEQFEDSLIDSQAAVRLMPCHFGAWAGMGHNCAHLGDLPRAIEAYSQALEINPHMHTVRDAVNELRAKVHE